MSMRSRSAITIAAGLGFAVLLSGCEFSAHVGNLDPSVTTTSAAARPAVPKALVEKNSADSLRPDAGGDPVSVSCPDDLPMEVGATEDCVVTRADKRYELKLTVTQADPPDSAKWDSTVGKLLPPAS
jgi:hypothetical protein